MATSIAQLNVTVYNGGTSQVAETFTQTNNSAVINTTFAFAFATGDNTMTAPTGAVSLVVSGITGTLKLYSSGNPSLSTSGMFILPASSLVINASAGATANLCWI